MTKNNLGTPVNLIFLARMGGRCVSFFSFKRGLSLKVTGKGEQGPNLMASCEMAVRDTDMAILRLIGGRFFRANLGPKKYLQDEAK